MTKNKRRTLRSGGLMIACLLLSTALASRSYAVPQTLTDITDLTNPWLVIGTGAVNDSTTVEGTFNKGIGDAWMISNYEIGAIKAPVPAPSSYGPGLDGNVPDVPGITLDDGPIVDGGPINGQLPQGQVITYDGQVAITHMGSDGGSGSTMIGTFNPSDAGIFAKYADDLTIQEKLNGGIGVTADVPLGIVCAGSATETGNGGCISGNSNTYFNADDWPNPIGDPEEASPKPDDSLLLAPNENPGDNKGITGDYNFAPLRTALDVALMGDDNGFEGIPNMTSLVAPIACKLEIDDNSSYLDVCSGSTLDLTKFDLQGQLNGSDVDKPTTLYIKLSDGLNIIDIETGDQDFTMTNAQIIIDGSEDARAIFRVKYGAKFNMNQSNILIGNMGIMNMNVMFFSATPGTVHKPVFEFNDTIFNGIAFWALGDGTAINVNNSQGCVQYVSDQVNFQNVRYNHCSFKGPPDNEVPAPSSALLILLGLLALSARRSRGNLTTIEADANAQQ